MSPTVFQALEERDKQIDALKRRLEEVSGDLDLNAALMDDVRNELHRSSRGPGDAQTRKIANMQSTLRAQQDSIKEADLRAQEVECRGVVFAKYISLCHWIFRSFFASLNYMFFWWQAETDARAKDKELSDALERMRQYEAVSDHQGLGFGIHLSPVQISVLDCLFTCCQKKTVPDSD